MISFKDFLKRKEVLNEELQDDFKVFFAKNDKAKVVNDWLKKNKNINFLKKNNKFKIQAIKEINKKLPEDKKIDEKDANEINEIVTKINDLYKRLENKKEGNVGEDKEGFITTLLDNSTKIKTIEQVDIETILKCFKKSNVNGDTKIDKKEFIEAIKEIKTKLDINKAAVILWLAYFRQCVIAASNNGSLITGEGVLSKGFVEKLQEKNTNNSFDDGNIDDLKRIFIEFGKFQMDLSVLKNFKSIDAAKKILQKKDEELENIAGNFTEKSQEEKEAEKQEEKKQQKSADMDAEADAIAKKAEETLKNISSNKDDTDDEIMQKRNWFIFNTMPPKPGKPEEIAEFRNNIEKEIKEFIDKIGEGLDKFKVNKLASNNLDNDQVQEMIKNCIKKNGMIFEDNDVLAREFEAYQEKIENIKKYAKDDISSMMEKLCKEANTKNNEIENENDYRKTVNLQAKFKQLFINYGYKISNRIKEAIAEADDVIRKAKKNKNSDEILGHKTADQKGQEQKDIDRISKILNSTYNKDTMNLARYMLINLLNNLHSSEEVLKQLNKKSFDKEMFDNGYIYAGSSGKVYVPAMPQKTEVKGGMAYSFPLVKTESFKNPASLLNAVGISLSSLNADVLKGLKETASNLKTEAENYINAAKELYNLIQSTIGNGSTVTEGLFGPKPNEDMSNFVKNVGNANKSNDVLNKICQKINLKNNFEPENNQPDDIALRQFLKGFTLIVIGNDRYVTSVDAFEKNKEQLIGKEEEKQQTIQTPQNANDELTPDEKVKAQSIENNGKVGETYDSSATEQSSVVTSANADSTYGDGYGYSKKAKAIKKKLNSTTYTYSPNSKLKIVRRTFD